ncbi:shikimate dehydrogenase [Erythrobacter sp. HKB08]|uniref:shikimate dehydrogenase n=1 Tax=Erythrobacter sp. HKB08 TaxID=2502843 RepID=UPI001008A570|nr:shikimate dehydrogenase [Erythrobacter sp. HKB08]
MSKRPYAEVIGDPIAQSKSPAIHGHWLRESGIEGDYRAQHVTAEGLADYLGERRSDPDWRGCNVTMPHKQAIIPLLDRLDPLARKIGAVNTVVRGADGTLTGYNTDAAGFLEPLGEELGKPHLFRMARILGTGGAARAIVAALSEAGFTLVLAGRNPDKARAMLDELAPGGEHHAIALDHFGAATDFVFDDREGIFDLVVNASPLGMTGQPALAFDLSHAPPGSLVYDIVTAPRRTPLLDAASKQGFATIEGLAMLIGQARAAFRLFFGETPPREGDAALMEELSR